MSNLERLKKGLANTGGVDTRLLKATEKQFGNLANLGYDEKTLAKISGVLNEVRAAGAKREALINQTVTPSLKEAYDIKGDSYDLKGEGPTGPVAARSAEEVDAALFDRVKRVTDELRKRQTKQQEIDRIANSAFGKDIGGPDDIDPGARDAQKRAHLFKEITKRALGAAGINLPDKAAGALGSIGALFGGALAVGQVGSNIKETQRATGISGGGTADTYGNAVLGAQQLPIIRQLSEAAGEFGSLFGLDTSTSKLKADIDRANEAAAIYEKFRVGARDASIEDEKVTRANAATLRGLDSQFKGLQLGGKAGRRFQVETGATEAIATATANRDDAQTNADKAIAEIERGYADATKNLRATASGLAGSAEGDAAKAELDRLDKAKEAAIKEQRKRKTDADATLKDQTAAINRNAALQADIISGKREDIAGVTDSIEELQKQTRGLSGDPFEAMRKSFDELKPSAESLSVFNAQLARYKTRLEEAEKESRKFTATKAINEALKGQTTAGLNPIEAQYVKDRNEGVEIDVAQAHRRRAINDAASQALADAARAGTLIGLSPEEQTLQGLINAGLDDKEIIAQVKVVLDTNAAKQIAADLKERIAASGDAVKQALAQTPLEKARAEVEAQDRIRRGPDGKGAGLSEAQKQQDIDAILNREYAGRAASTIDRGRTPQEIFKRAADDLKEQYARGFLTDEQLKRGLGGALSDEANGLRTSRPELLEQGSAAAAQFIAVSSGAVLDASKPEIQLAKEANGLLAEIRDAAKGRRPANIRS